MVEQLPLKQLVPRSSRGGGTRLYNLIEIEYTKNMALNTKEKTKIIKEVGINEKDTGSCEVQIALLSKEIEKLVSHLKKHPQDLHSKRGLIKMVVQRKKLLAYLKKASEQRYSAAIKKIGLKK